CECCSKTNVKSRLVPKVLQVYLLLFLFLLGFSIPIIDSFAIVIIVSPFLF
ncbi:hypothetical protein BDR26DRAFT_834802, partial [Obelidium mucronatum]